MLCICSFLTCCCLLLKKHISAVSIHFKDSLIYVRINKIQSKCTAVRGGRGSKVRYNGQGKMKFGQGKDSEFHFRLRVGTLL